MENTIGTFILSGTIWQIVANSSAFGKFILIVLVFMSLTSWAIIFAKWRQYRSAEDADNRFRQAFRRADRMSDALGQARSVPKSPLAQVFLAGYNELDALANAKDGAGGLAESRTKLDVHDFEVLEMSLERTLTEQVGILRSRVIFLATTGNSAPFMGLLGTVVGIMDSFWAIGERGSASLAVVAPGIAEALLATIVGLGAAIPAVIAYNWANNKLRYASDSIHGFIMEFVARAKKESA